MIEIHTIAVTAFEQNCRLLHNKETASAVLIDPGGEADKIIATLKQLDCKLEAVWLTHSHLDHCGAVADLFQEMPAKLFGSEIEREMRAHVANIASMYGFPPGELKDCPEPDQYLFEGDQVEFAGNTFQVLYTPGHSPGHLCFYQPDEKILLAGDTVFASSIGRTDLPGGDHATLLHSIKTKILSLPDETRILSGHGPDTTVGQERTSNPFLVDL